MSSNSFLGRDVDLAELAARTKNFSGAEIEGLVKSATSFALNRQVDVTDLSKPIDEEAIKVGGPNGWRGSAGEVSRGWGQPGLEPGKQGGMCQGAKQGIYQWPARLIVHLWCACLPGPPPACLPACRSPWQTSSRRWMR